MRVDAPYAKRRVKRWRMRRWMSRGEERRVLRPSSWRIREVVVGEDMVAG